MTEDPRFTSVLPGELSIAVGQTLRLPLTSAMGSGNTWHAELDGSAAQVAVEVTGPPRAEVLGGLPPSTSSAAETLAVTGIRAGAARLRLVLSRSWQPDTPLAQHQLVVTVTGEGGPAGADVG